MEIERPGARVYYDVQGNGPALVFLHAFPLNGDMWEQQVCRLRAEMTCVIPDLRGHGRTRVTPPWTVDDLAGDALAILDRLGFAQAFFCGLSMGGYVAMAVARAAPGRVRALVLADTRAGPDTPARIHARRAQAQRARSEGVAPVVEELLPRLLGRTTRARRPEVTARVRELALSTTPEGLAGSLEMMASRADARPALARCQAPVLVMVGSEDALTTPKDFATIARKAPHSVLIRLPGAGHLSNLETADLFTAELRQFLAALA